MKRVILILTAILMICSFAAGETVQESFRDGDFIYADFISDVSSIPYSEALNEAEQELDDRLRAMKMEADGLFGELDEYGIIQRGNDAMLNSVQ